MSNVIAWINDTIINSENDKIEANEINDIKDFALIWNLFENLLCDKYANMDKINNIIDTKFSLFHITEYKEFFDYFYNRYKNNDNKFNALKLKNGDKELVEKVLNDEYTDKNNQLKFILAIIYRYRNNLFHGEKDMRYIRLQKENFKQANEFLMYFIETCKDN